MSIVDFGDTRVREVMTPRTDIVWIDEAGSLTVLADLFVETKYSRIPVVRGTIDKVVGIVHVKDALEAMRAGAVGTIAELLREAYFVPETKKVSELLREFQRRHLWMAIVVDEYGGVSGLVTVEDLLEEIVGEISDEHEDEREPVSRTGESTYSVSGKENIEIVRELFGRGPGGGGVHDARRLPADPPRPHSEAGRDAPRVGPAVHGRGGGPAPGPPRAGRADAPARRRDSAAAASDLTTSPDASRRGRRRRPAERRQVHARQRLVGEKVAIVSDKPQTTRKRILGVARRPGAEIALVDTPGIHRPEYRMNAAMVRDATDALATADALLFVVDATESRGAGRRVRRGSREAGRGPVVLAVNKIDLLRKDRLMPLMAAISADEAFRGFDEVVPISAKTGDSVERLLEVLAAKLSRGGGGVSGGLPDGDAGDRMDRRGHPRKAARAHARRAAVRARRRRRVGGAGRGKGHHGRQGHDRRRARGSEGNRRRQGRHDDPRDRKGGARGARAGARPPVLPRAHRPRAARLAQRRAVPVEAERERDGLTRG